MLWLKKKSNKLEELRNLVEKPFLAFRDKSDIHFDIETRLYFFDENAYYDLSQSESLADLNLKLESTSPKKGSVFNLGLIVETSNGHSLFTDLIHSGKFKKRGFFRKFLASYWSKCQSLLVGSHCVDEHHTDQILLYCCLATGVSRLKTRKLSLHSRAVIELAKIYLKAQIDVVELIDGSCELTIQGVGFQNK